jgi:hypothetical protein
MRSKCKRRRINNAASAPYLTGSGSALNMSLSYDVWNSEKTPVETPAKTPVIELPARTSSTSHLFRGCGSAGEYGHEQCLATVECLFRCAPYEEDFDPIVTVEDVEQWRASGGPDSGSPDPRGPAPRPDALYSYSKQEWEYSKPDEDEDEEAAAASVTELPTASSPTDACKWCNKANPCFVHDIDAVCGGPSPHMDGTFTEAKASRNCTPPE